MKGMWNRFIFLQAITIQLWLGFLLIFYPNVANSSYIRVYTNVFSMRPWQVSGVLIFFSLLGLYGFYLSRQFKYQGDGTGTDRLRLKSSFFFMFPHSMLLISGFGAIRTLIEGSNLGGTAHPPEILAATFSYPIVLMVFYTLAALDHSTAGEIWPEIAHFPKRVAGWLIRSREAKDEAKDEAKEL